MESIKEMLIKGCSPEELINNLKKDIEDAQKEIAEEERKDTIDEARDTLIYAFDDYMEAIGVSDSSSFTNKHYDEMEMLLKELEKNISAADEKVKKAKAPVDVKITKVDAKDIDSIIDEFLKSLL
jgi:flagellar biosynthesis chaperone FliJ